MNISTIMSFAIGAILLLAVFSTNSRVVLNSSDVTIDQIIKENINNVAEVVSYDFRKMGYGVTGAAIVSANKNEITFKSDLGNDGTVNLVTWKFNPTQSVPESVNPNDFMLTRIVDGVTTDINMVVVKFDITLLDNANNVVLNTLNAKKIKVEVVCQGAEPIDGKYNETAWQKVFQPWNIQ
ncbi:MAG TPA: hypothetical protein VJ991_14415 [Balneolales bacterium]|nr:hypothetical protein [Balneolales bacterium]HYX05802.1 hypothetical protein [Bacteroidales bacterium]